MRQIILACGIVMLAAQAGEARTPARLIDCNDRGCFERSPQKVKPNYKQHRETRYAKRSRLQANKGRHRSVAVSRVAERVNVQILPHPVGCPPRLFCGCGTSLYLLGKAVARGGLAIAANWLNLPGAACAPRMAAARRGHVFAIVECLPGNRALAYDPNSGRHLTRLHVVSLNGYRVVNPRG